MRENLWRVWFTFVLVLTLAVMAFYVREWRDCKTRDGIFIATQYNWPICLDKGALR